MAIQGNNIAESDKKSPQLASRAYFIRLAVKVRHFRPSPHAPYPHRYKAVECCR